MALGSALPAAVGPAAAQAPDTAAGSAPLYPDTLVTTDHQMQVGGEAIRYTATTGYLPLRDESGTVEAWMFYIAYTRDDAGDDRPVTYTFNGGPGSSSVWLHLGGVGPKRVSVVQGDSTEVQPPPYRLRDNPESWLRFTDLVFIDPVTTGFSRSTSAVSSDRFHGYEGDIESVGRFIRLWTTRNERWDSPKFLAGESYGTVRAAGLARHLQQRHGMYLNGVVLVSAVLDYQANAFDVGNDRVYPLFLPTYAATAHYHGELPAEQQQMDLQALLDEVERFALNEYAPALMKGNDLPEARRQDIAERLHRYTGLATDFIRDTNLRIRDQHFYKELRREDGLTVGRLDSRFAGRDRTDAGSEPGYDPSYAAIRGPFTGAFNEYVRDDLGFETDLKYEILTGRVRPWSYDRFENRYLNVAEPLRQAMHQNPALKVHVASGVYDVATPYFATEYVLDHMGLADGLQDNVSVSTYRAGHMMYIRDASLERLYRQVSGFYDEATR